MSRAQRLVIVVLALSAVVAVGARVLAWRTAAEDFDRAAATRASVQEKAERVAVLRAQPAVNGFGARPGDDVMSLATRVLDAAHVPAARLRSVQPEADRVVADDRDGRRAATVRLALEPLTVPELGAFLTAWRKGQQVWSVSRIDLNAAPSAGAGGGAGSYRAAITVTATYLDDPSPVVAPSNSPTSQPSAPSKSGSPLVGRSQ